MVKKTIREIDGTLTKRKDTVISEFGKRHNIWEFDSTNPSKDKSAHKHPAIFPEKLAEDHIISWSNEGDTVLDPMCGSGTTLKMAQKNNRNFIGIEISPEYCKIAEERLKNLQQTLI